MLGRWPCHGGHRQAGEGRGRGRPAPPGRKRARAALAEGPPESPHSEEVWRAAAALAPEFARLDRLVARNQARVQAAMRRAGLAPHHFQGSTGYGHGDVGRAALDQIFAEVMGAEAALVRPQFVSGTHAIATALFAVLRPGGELLAVAGDPYDTLEEVIGLRGRAGHGSLREWGVAYRALPLAPDGHIDFAALPSALRPETRLALIQRSCGYALRPTVTLAEIARAVALIKGARPGTLVAVDNCYGEFTEAAEPCSVGADLVMGSLIKSPGGTLVPTGGYIAGKRELVEAGAARLTAPGVGVDAGAVDGAALRLMAQGFYLGPQNVGEALKGGRLIARVLEGRGFRVWPPSGDPSGDPSGPPGGHPRGTTASPATEGAQEPAPVESLPEGPPGPAPPWGPSFITAVQLGSPERMCAFCSALQKCLPVEAFIEPVPGATPGYADEVVFANGAFINGSTSELSADGPLRPPHVVYCQGGTHWTQWATALARILGAL